MIMTWIGRNLDAEPEPELSICNDQIKCVPDRAYQPTIMKFPKQTFGKQQQTFHLSWFINKFPWLHNRKEKTMFTVIIARILSYY